MKKYISLRAASGDNYNDNTADNLNYNPIRANEAVRLGLEESPAAVNEIQAVGVNNPKFDINGETIT